MEKWKKAETRGFTNDYLVSTEGQVKSLPRNITRRGGKPLTVKGQTLKRSYINGYPVVTLYNSGKSKQFFVHKLVLETFIELRPRGLQACHFPDRDKNNCKVTNLRWGTSKENHEDRIKHGTTNKNNLYLFNSGSKHCRSKLTEAQVRMILALLKTKDFTYQELADIFQVNVSSIWMISKGTLWKHITRPHLFKIRKVVG